MKSSKYCDEHPKNILYYLQKFSSEFNSKKQSSNNFCRPSLGRLPKLNSTWYLSHHLVFYLYYVQLSLNYVLSSVSNMKSNIVHTTSFTKLTLVRGTWNLVPGTVKKPCTIKRRKSRTIWYLQKYYTVRKNTMYYFALATALQYIYIIL